MPHSHCKKDAIVHQLLGVEAQVTVTPLIKPGEPAIYCVESDIEPGCPGEKKGHHPPGPGKCTFTVRQVICVEIPITFGVEVDVEKGIVCGPPEVGPCHSCLRSPSLTEPQEAESPQEPKPPIE